MEMMSSMARWTMTSSMEAMWVMTAQRAGMVLIISMAANGSGHLPSLMMSATRLKTLGTDGGSDTVHFSLLLSDNYTMGEAIEKVIMPALHR